MDKWIVGLSQHFEKGSSDDSGFSVPESPNKCSLHKLVKREKEVKDVRNECFCVGGIGEAATSEFDGEKGVVIGEYEGSRVLLKPLSYRNKRSLRSRRANGRVIRPVSSLESCLSAQLFKEHVEMEDYVFGSFGSPLMQSMRPFYVMDGSEVTSRASDDVFTVQNGNVEKKLKKYPEVNNDVSGVPSLPNRRGRLNNSTTMATGKHFDLSSGSSHTTLLLCLGVSFGIISSFMAKKREVEKLNALLKQTENFVQDLHEELEMKDALIVQELSAEEDKFEPLSNNNVSLDDGSLCSITQHDMEESTSYDSRVFDDRIAKSDSLSNIEEELEAELEMLELNITTSSMKGRFSNLVELEQDNDHSANYAVSPRELSLRLHEVLESQLKERIRELEEEIEKKQTRNHKSFQSWKHYADEPVVLNLSGEALDAYSEAYDQFSKVSDSEEDEATDSGQTGHTSCLPGNNWTPQNGKDFGVDETEKMLIKHIVEEARKGSPAVLNAQRALFSMDL